MFESLIRWMLAKAALRFILRRAIEPSSLGSLARLLGALGIVLNPQHWEIILAVAAFISEVIFGMGSADKWDRADRWMRDKERKLGGAEVPYSDSPTDYARGQDSRKSGFEDLESFMGRWESSK